MGDPIDPGVWAPSSAWRGAAQAETSGVELAPWPHDDHAGGHLRRRGAYLAVVGAAKLSHMTPGRGGNVVHNRVGGGLFFVSNEVSNDVLNKM